ncbi:uncharacterized protein N0V89_011979 [Didymosphaeria variabile]|uniref:Uncharacterized protein n=1 Tax=Didymosphaeria variabile TaxID=1932322 RepID=A0A9W9C694_9PLEO|nr:uncharacterized protein N0V89_011979 [Didymosphaeria variabile]KAJ4345844.1 hypothetical protein N0V89_011979 [Didymosphaeria variabile]
MSLSRSPNGLLELSKAPDHLVAIVTKNATESPLLRLPAEMRNRIFRFASGGCEIHITRRPLRAVSSETPPPLLDANEPAFLYAKVFEQVTDHPLTLSHTGLNLALVSRQVYCGVGLWLSEFMTALKPAQIAAFQSILLKNNGRAVLLELFDLLTRRRRMTSTFPAMQKIFIRWRLRAQDDCVPSWLETPLRLTSFEDMGTGEGGRTVEVMMCKVRRQ